ncbi:MAG TPA: iron ABC transporter permease, partial [Longimicrobiaceae bacterium]
MRALARLLVLSAALGLALLAAMRMGAVPLSIGEIAAAMVGRGDPAAVAIVRELRLPRSVLAALVGAALAASGATFQALLRNPLAEPYILGVSGGAAVGAVAAIVLGVAAAGWVLPVAAFAGAIVAIALVLRIALSVGQTLDTRILLLAGVVVGAFFNACILLALTFADTESFRSAVFWMMGSFSGATWAQSGALTLYLVPGLLVLFALARPLDLLAIGEETATHLGVRVEATKYVAYGMASLLAAASVAVAGVIGFVGLIIPHFVRLLWEPGHRFLLPASALLGAAFLVLTDALARSVAAPTELPVGVLTAFVGVPFFVWVLRTSGRRQAAGTGNAARATVSAPSPPSVIPSAARDLHLAAGTAPEVQIPRCARDDRGVTRDDRGVTRDDGGATRDDWGVTRDDRGAGQALAATHLTFRYPGAERD